MFLDMNNPEDQETIEKVKDIFVDKKRIVAYIAFDTEEGWIDIPVPKFEKIQDSITGVNLEAPGFFDIEKKRIYGEVKVVWND